MDFLEEELEEILNIFREESEEQIQKINQNLLKLEANPGDDLAIAELFREAHSLKGAARMIGLNDIQTLAHKLEDIFGLAKDGSLQINANIVDVLCKTIDCISSIVEESIQTKGQSHSTNVDLMMEQLLEVEKDASQINVSYIEEKILQNKETEEDLDLDKNEFELDSELKETIDQTGKNIAKFEEFSTDTTIIKETLYFLNIIDEKIGSTISFKASNYLQDIKMKLESVLKGSGILISAEVTELLETYNLFQKGIMRDLNKDDPSAKEKQKENINKKLDQIVESKPVDIIQDINNNDPFDFIMETLNKTEELEIIEYISNNLPILSANPDFSSDVISNLVKHLNEVVNLNVDAEAKKIFKKIHEIVVFSVETLTVPDKELVELIKQSFDSAKKIVFSINHEIEEDTNLILQRLTILQQMLKISASETPEQKNAEISAKIDYSPVVKNTEIISKSENQDFNSSEELKSNENTTIKTLRVDTKKLDQLVSQVGELIIAKIKAKEHLLEIERINRLVEDWYREWNKAKQSLKYFDRKAMKPSEMPSGTSTYSQNKNIYSFFEESSIKLSAFMKHMNTLYRIIQEDDARLNLIVNELEEKIKSIRVLPLATIFHMFPRMVRDIARAKGKEIELEISGSETSADKKIIEEIKSPLMHIIRNSIDHGIEEPEIRTKNGKNPVGKILLSAYHLENSVLIEIVDDGRGIDIEAIKRKVLEKQLLTKEELNAMNDNQIMNIIFWPGFSTGEIVTDISGRGIGLDIVHTKITQLNGKVNIKSTLGEGCKVSIQLPVTMATIKSFLVKVNNQTFAIPTAAIKTALLVKPEDIFFKEGRETIVVENKTIPICSLSRALEMPDSMINKGKVVVVIIQAEDVQVGFIIDRLIGDQEILHKNLTPPLLRVRNVAGVTTLGSGELCLILNVNDLVKSAYNLFGMHKKELIVNRENSTTVIKKNILVVDDSITTRILERNILRAAGYNVTVAVNGLDALTKVGAEKYDLIVSDVEMPEIDGFELTERLKQDDKHKNIPIVLVTSLVSEIDRMKGLGLGANAYITKGSFNQEELLSTIRKLISLS